MTYSNRGGGFGGRSNNNRFSGADRGYDRPQMFQATCDQCGKSCEVPFRPSGSKPIYCSSCFEGKNNNGSERRFDRNDRERREFSPRPQFVPTKQSTYVEEFATISRKLDKILDILNSKQDISSDLTKKIKKAIKDTKAKKEEAESVVES